MRFNGAEADCDDGSCETLFGDANNDWIVDLNDLQAVIENYGCMNNCSGDANGDGVVNILDLIAVSNSLED